MKKLILLLLFLPLVSLGQDTIPMTKILTQKEAYKKKMMKLKKDYMAKHKDKIKVGNTSFDAKDRIAIRDVIDADKHLSAEAKGDILICLEEELRKKHFNYQPELGV